MLSVPWSSLESFATISSSNYYMPFARGVLFYNFFCIHYAVSSVYLHSHTPSQHMKMKCKSFRSMIVTSGKDVIICSYGLSYLFYLNYRSPIARDRFKHPFTLPYYTKPPAFIILCSSLATKGLWSVVKRLV